MKNLNSISSVGLLLMRNADNAGQVDAELDRRNQQAARSVARRKRKPKFLMADFYFENNRWDLATEMRTQLMTANDQELVSLMNVALMSQVALSSPEDKEHWRNLASCSLLILEERGVTPSKGKDNLYTL